MILIAGLGNPTIRYKKTRHNIGFDTIDRVADTYGIRISRKESNALTGSGMIAGQKGGKFNVSCYKTAFSAQSAAGRYSGDSRLP